MRRREVIALIPGTIAWPLAVGAQPQKVARIGFLTAGSLAMRSELIDAFRQGLLELGYVEGTSIVVEYREAHSVVERFPVLASELVHLGVDLIVASNSLAARAAHQATGTIPIVVPVMGDAVGDGLVASLARPGGNVTGLTFLGPELVPKRLALLQEALPTVSRVAALWHPGAYGERTMTDMMSQTEDAARALGIHLRLIAVQGPEEFDRAFSAMVGERADALIVFPSPMLFTERRRIIRLATEHRLPSMAMGREFVKLGGLMAYGASMTDLHRRAATYVDRILKGAQPSDLPVEQPTIFELVINLGTARSLGLTIPPTLLARADEVIE